jgi:hypothetical protein
MVMSAVLGPSSSSSLQEMKVKVDMANKARNNTFNLFIIAFSFLSAVVLSTVALKKKKFQENVQSGTFGHVNRL